MKNRFAMKVFILVVSITSISAGTSIIRIEQRPSSLINISKTLIEVDRKTKIYVDKLNSYEKIINDSSSADVR